MTLAPPQKAQPTAPEAQNTRPTPIDRHMRNPRSRKASIDAFCWSCMGGDGNVGVSRMIRECSSPGCSLFGFRPYQMKKAG
jgi:hypothetical protein